TVAAAGVYDQNAALTGNLVTASTNADIGANITGTVTQNGATSATLVSAASVVSGQVTVNGGTLTVTASLTADNGGTVTDDLVVASAGALVNSGTVTGNVANAGAVTLNGGSTLTGDLTQSGGSLTTAAGTVTVNGLLDLNDGTFLVADGVTFNATSADLAAAVTAPAGNLVGAGSTLAATGGNFVNAASFGLGAAATLSSSATLSNSGTLTFAGDATLAGGTSVTNSGTLLVNQVAGVQTLSVTTGTFTDTGTINMSDTDTVDVVDITGNAVLNGTIMADVDVSNTAAGTRGDLVNVSGTATGSTALLLNNVGGNFSNIATPIDLIKAAGGTGGLSASFSGLQTGAYTYSLQNTGTAIQLTASPNLAFGGVVSGVAATQSLISTVVNRPSSALVTPLVDPGDDPCAIGEWARLTGGKANAKLGTTSQTTGVSAINDIALSYGGIQAGFDNSCSGGYYNGWDLAYGVMLGTNMGRSSLPVTLGGVSTTVKSDFDQLFGGVYLSAAKGNWFGDLNLRADRTTYDLRETSTFGSGGLGLPDQEFDSRGKTLSGSLSYSHTLDQERGIRLVPTVGFSLSHIETDTIQIDNDPTDPTDDAELKIGDIDQKIGFVGATLAKTSIRPSGKAAVTYFATGTYFNDFGDDLTSTFTVKSTGASQSLTSDNLGGFGELSLGMNYTRIMDGGGAMAPRQMDASIRADTRFSEQLDSWGLTAQVRLQF
ncbi:beta strand repeat-containing protein, partial [Sagittula salina]|nr:transporter [Sagittula salina]